MKKILYFLIIIITAISCNNKTENVAEVKQKEPKLTLKLQPFLNSKIVEGNNLAENKLAEEASDVYINLLKDENSISDYPLFFETGLDAGNGKSWVKFRTGFMTEEIEKIKNYKDYDKISFQILGKIDNEKAQSLQKNTPYFLSGKLIEKGWRGSESYYEYNQSYMDNKFTFGNVTYKINEIK